MENERKHGKGSSTVSITLGSNFNQPASYHRLIFHRLITPYPLKLVQNAFLGKRFCFCEFFLSLSLSQIVLAHIRFESHSSRVAIWYTVTPASILDTVQYCD